MSGELPARARRSGHSLCPWRQTSIRPVHGGAAFLTDHGAEQTIWTVIEAYRRLGRLRYSRVSPGKRAGIVEVAPSAGGSAVTVSYDMTALSPEGMDVARSMEDAGFGGMMAEWSRLIRNSL